MLKRVDLILCTLSEQGKYLFWTHAHTRARKHTPARAHTRTHTILQQQELYELTDRERVNETIPNPRWNRYIVITNKHITSTVQFSLLSTHSLDMTRHYVLPYSVTTGIWDGFSYRFRKYSTVSTSKPSSSATLCCVISVVMFCFSIGWLGSGTDFIGWYTRHVAATLVDSSTLFLGAFDVFLLTSGTGLRDCTDEEVNLARFIWRSFVIESRLAGQSALVNAFSCNNQTFFPRYLVFYILAFHSWSTMMSFLICLHHILLKNRSLVLLCYLYLCYIFEQ